MVEPLDPSSVRPGRVGRDLVILPAGAAETRHLRWKMLGGVACGVALAAALGFGGGMYLRAAPEPVPQQAPPQQALLQKADVAQLVAQGEARQSKEMRRLSDELRGLKTSLASLQASVERSQQGTDVKALKASVEALRQNVDAVKSDTGAAIGQLSGKVDRADQATAQKLVQIAERLDRLEKKPDPMPVGSIPPKPPVKPVPARQSQDAASPKLKVAEAAPNKPAETVAPLPRPKTAIPGWVLREVYDGYALVEGRSGYQEVAIGQMIPGAGRVEAIERRGNRWVVVTSLGLIASDWN